MSQQGNKPSTGAETTAKPTTLEAALAQLAETQAQVAKMLQFQQRALPRRRKTLREFLKQNPRKILIRPVYQNGREVDPSGLSDETIKKLDTLATGVYGDGMINVIRLTDGLHSRIHLMYSNKSIEQRMSLYIKFPSFTSIVNTVVNEMKARGVEPVIEPPPPGAIEPEPDDDENV